MSRLLRGLAATLLALSSLAAAQDVTSTGTTSASLALSGHLVVAPRLQLRLSTPELVFDLRPGARRDDGQVCVAGSGADVPLNPAILASDRLAPAGTDYRVTAYPAIDIVGGEPVPAGAWNQTGQQSVVCYRAFELGLFSNEEVWQLRADRSPVEGAPGIQQLYLGASCRGDGGGGMAALPLGGSTTLASGETADDCHDLLVVVAVKVSGEAAGASLAKIRYTLMSLDGALADRDEAP